MPGVALVREILDILRRRCAGKCSGYAKYGQLFAVFALATMSFAVFLWRSTSLPPDPPGMVEEEDAPVVLPIMDEPPVSAKDDLMRAYVLVPPADLQVIRSLPIPCRRHLPGETCWDKMDWARRIGIYQHPEWYPGLTECSTEAEFQDLFLRQGLHECKAPCQAGVLPLGMPRCSHPDVGDVCFVMIEWARTLGISDNPYYFPGLNRFSTSTMFQDFFHRGAANISQFASLQHHCGPPCETPRPSAERPMRATPEGVCMYELPAKFNLELRDSVLNLPQPRGLPLQQNGWHLAGLTDQNQFGLERVFFHRMQAAATTLRMPADCRAFYVPYFSTWETSDVLGLWRDVQRPHLDQELSQHLVHYGRHRRRRCARTTPGFDHFMILGRIARDARTIIENDNFKDMIKLTIEETFLGVWDHVFSVPYPAWFQYTPRLEPTGGPQHIASVKLNCAFLQKWANETCGGKQFCSFDLHRMFSQYGNYTQLCPGVALLEGQYMCGDVARNITANISMNMTPGMARTAAQVVFSCQVGPCWLTSTCQERLRGTPAPYLVSVIGSAKRKEVTRQALIQQCMDRPRDCKYVATGMRSKSNSVLKKRVAGFAEVLMTGTFCLNPPGDTPTRKGLFDSMLAGCIPVIVTPDSLTRYKWHLPNWEALSVVLPADRGEDFNVVDYLVLLKRNQPELVLQKMKELQRTAYRLQYSMRPNSERGLDAFEVALQKVLEYNRNLSLRQ